MTVLTGHPHRTNKHSWVTRAAFAVLVAMIAAAGFLYLGWPPESEPQRVSDLRAASTTSDPSGLGAILSVDYDPTPTS